MITEKSGFRNSRRIAVASRRKAEAYIREGKVKVNGRIVTEMGTTVTKRDRVEVDGNQLTSRK